MSLLRLLATGKSLIGLEGSQNRYQVSRQKLLPSFATKKNPFRGTIRPEAQPGALVTTPSRTGNASPIPAASLSAVSDAPATVSQPAAALPPEVARKDVQVASPPRQSPLPLNRNSAAPPSGNGKFSSRLNALFPWRHVKAANSLVREQPKSLVQAELSLESVRVVRNDLSDCDLELVRPQPPQPLPRAASAGRKPQSSLVSGTAWSRVTGRLFGAGKL
jgi:hypothetical protein